MSNELSESSKNIIRVVFYHKIWEEGELPRVWKEAVIVPIRRPGDDDTNPADDRPTALTSRVCKIMERMRNERLMYHYGLKIRVDSEGEAAPWTLRWV